uniref:Uncharacterized protein n=1 Tax=Cebus imitator TaxID=2715852 RepID=A0A2K5RLV4_CEBIM
RSGSIRPLAGFLPSTPGHSPGPLPALLSCPPSLCGGAAQAGDPIALLRGPEKWVLCSGIKAHALRPPWALRLLPESEWAPWQPQLHCEPKWLRSRNSKPHKGGGPRRRAERGACSCGPREGSSRDTCQIPCH